MSSVLHIFLQSFEGDNSPGRPMIRAKEREILYKSVSRFWEIYRNTDSINANIMFSLREIRTCLRKIKDDQTSLNTAIIKTSNIIDIALNVANKEYWAALGALIKVLDVSIEFFFSFFLFFPFSFFTFYLQILKICSPQLKFILYHFITSFH